MTSTDLIELAKVLEHTAAYARHVAADLDAGREPKVGELRRWLQEAGEALAGQKFGDIAPDCDRMPPCDL